jgi:hypothetical protein
MARWVWTLLKFVFAALLAIVGFILPPELHWWWTGAGDADEGASRRRAKGRAHRKIRGHVA